MFPTYTLTQKVGPILTTILNVDSLYCFLYLITQKVAVITVSFLPL